MVNSIEKDGLLVKHQLNLPLPVGGTNSVDLMCLQPHFYRVPQLGVVAMVEVSGSAVSMALSWMVNLPASSQTPSEVS